MNIYELTVDRWADFEALMRSDKQCKECWCLNHRMPPDCAPTGDKARISMQAEVEQGRVGGLLAYSEATCCGWISIDRMIDLPGHDCQATGVADEWAIHCIYVAPEFRGRGISRLLVQAAIDFAKRQGALLVSAFPIPAVYRSKFPEGVAEFSGRESTFEGLGFQRSRQINEFYHRFEKAL